MKELDSVPGYGLYASSMNSATPYRSSLIAGVLAALGASACCLGPLLLVTMGLGGAWVGSLRYFEPFQPVLVLVTLACFGWAFRRLYIEPRRCKPGDVCAVPAVPRRQRIVFWIVAVIVAAILTFPLYASLFY